MLAQWIDNVTFDFLVLVGGWIAVGVLVLVAGVCAFLPNKRILEMVGWLAVILAPVIAGISIVENRHRIRFTFEDLWLFAIFCGPLAVLGVGTIALARWQQGRRADMMAGRCLKCGYDLTGLRSPRCPECGTPFTTAATVDLR